MNGAKESHAWQEVLVGAALALVGVAVVELLLLAGHTPLAPVGWPALGAIFAAALYGPRGLLGAIVVVVGYYLLHASHPGRFPAFFASAGLSIAWLCGTGLLCGLVLALRSRLAVALRAEMRELASRHSEERFRHLTQLSSDWYWEQDEHFRFTFVSSAAHDHALSPQTLIGKHRWDFPAANLTEEDWRRHRAQLERHEPFRNLVAERRDATGQRRWSSINGDPVFDARGRFTGYRGVGRDITAEKLAEEAARQSEARLQLVADNSPALIGYVDSEERFRFHNLAYETWFGMHDIIGRTLREVWGEERYASMRPNVERALRGERVSYEYKAIDTAGQERQVLATYVPDLDAAGTVRGFFVLGTDVTTLARARHELQQAHERLEHALEGSSAALWDTDLRSGRVYLSDPWAAMLGRPPGETVTTTAALSQLAHPEDMPAIQKASRDVLKGLRAGYEVEHRVRGADGEWRWILSRGRVTERDPASGRALRMIGTNLDITGRKQAEEQLKFATQTDALTGLANRTLLLDRIRLAMARSVRTGAPAALLYLDIDRFKEVNDSFGHAAGDAVLRDFAGRLRACVRQTDTVARIGGDEFVVLLEDLKDAGDAQRIAEKILAASQRPAQAEHRPIDVRISIGLAAAGGDADEAAWLARADAALYRAKHEGRNRIAVAA